MNFNTIGLERKYIANVRPGLEPNVIFPGGGGGTPYNGLCGKAPPERGTLFTLQVYERVGISRVEVYERVGKSLN